MHIAVVGAGISGLACARELQALGHVVTVYEKHDDIGGRTATWKTELGSFDYGAQFFTAVSDPFKKEVAQWRAAGVAAPWHGNFVRLEGGNIIPARPSSQRFVAVPGMAALASHLGAGLDVRTGHIVKRVAPTGKPGCQQWLLAVQTEGASIKTQEGPFDVVVMATPANAAAHLLKVVPSLSSKAEMVGHVACWALMLAFSQPLDLPYDGAWLSHPRLAWIARDTSKPEREAGERWIALARVEWSGEHLKDTPARVREVLLNAFGEATGIAAAPQMAMARLWPYAQSIRPLAKNCLWDEKFRVGACGDWFGAGLEGSGQIEHAYLSGVMLAARIGK